MFNNDFVEYAQARSDNPRRNGGFARAFAALDSDLFISDGDRESTRQHVDNYASDEGALRTDFASFMDRLCQM